MNLDPWLTRIKDRCPSVQNRVFVAVELANTEPAALQTPCVFVVPLAEKSGTASNSGQKVTLQIAVVSVIKNVSDYRGSEAYNQLDALRAELIQALSGWQPEIGKTSTQYLGGSLNYFDSLIVSWVDRFELDYFLKYEGRR